MSKEAVLGAVRRGLRRGPLPEDQAAMLRARIAAHPRHLIPARSRVPRPEQINLLVRNIEKEFGTVARVSDAEAVPDAVATYLAARNLPSALAMAPHPALQAMPWHRRPLLQRREGRAEAAGLERRLSDLVNLSYGLTPEEVDLLWRTAPPRMPRF